jgi:hypothetical protein
MILFNRKSNEKARSWINPAAMMSDSDSYSSLEDSEILSNSTNLIEKENFDQLVQEITVLEVQAGEGVVNTAYK